MQQQNSSSSSGGGRSSSSDGGETREKIRGSVEEGMRQERMRCRMDKSFFVGRTIKRYHAAARTAKWEEPDADADWIRSPYRAPFTVATHGSHARIRYHSSQVCSRYSTEPAHSRTRRILYALMRLGRIEGFFQNDIIFLNLPAQRDAFVQNSIFLQDRATAALRQTSAIIYYKFIKHIFF